MNDEIRKLLGGDPVNVKKPGGYIIVDGQEVAQTLQCCHCQRHWVVIKGSGKVRGWCHACKKVTCGGEVCNTYHAPKEAILDFQDGGGVAPKKQIEVTKKLLKMFPGIEKLANL